MEKSKTTLKLDYKRTLIIGFAFFGILMLWQVYNTYCPVILSELLMQKMSVTESSDVQWIVGIIMALDNIFALFMLPIFGSLSDKTKSKYGKRMPYIVVGTILSAIALPFIPLAFAYNSLWGTIIMMLLVLIFMNAYRNPAVSLMPDITPKPLRAKANGLINLVGYVGAIMAGAIALFITTKKYFTSLTSDGLPNPTYQSWEIYLPFIITSVLMIISMILLAWRINENKILEETKLAMEEGEREAEVIEEIKEDEKLGKENLRNFILMIVAIFLWFAAFNATETFWSNYCTYNIDFESYSMATNVLAIASLVSFVPAGMLASKIGRKWTVLLGILLCVLPLGACFFISPAILGEGGLVSNASYLGYIYYVLFAIAGVGWAFINCCSYPMVVELASSKNIGKFTGAYYASSMLAQSLTPVILGVLMCSETFAYNVMFPYSAILFIAAGVVFFFVKEKRKTPVTIKKGLEAFDQD